MENYSKARTVEQPCPSPFPDLPADTPEVRVKDGSKIRNLMRFALSRMEEKPSSSSGGAAAENDAGAGEGRGGEDPAEMPAPTRGEKPPCRQIVFTGVGAGAAKAITCVEILKRRVRGLHQSTRLRYRGVRDVWEPLEPAAGLDALTVSRSLPAVWVLLSRDPLDAGQPGYQAPGCFDALWAQAAREEAAAGGQRHGQRRKRGGGGGGGSGRGKGSGRQTGRLREARKAPGHSGVGQE